MDKAVELIQQWGGKLAELAQQVGPEIAQVAMTALAIQHIGQLAVGIAMMLIGFGFLFLAFRCGKRIHREMQLPSREQDEDVKFGCGLMALFLSAPGLLIFCIGLFEKVLNPWNWAALYDPRLIIAKKVLGL